MLSAAIMLAIALAIFLGYKTKINTGLFCIVFAYIIGCFVMGLKPKQVIGYWPTSTMFVILSVSLFYNFAAIIWNTGENVRCALICVPQISGASSLCAACRSGDLIRHGSYLFHRSGIPCPDHPGDL